MVEGGEDLRLAFEPVAAIGCTMVGVAGGGVEVEDAPGLSVLAATFGAAVRAGIQRSKASNSLSGSIGLAK